MNAPLPITAVRDVAQQLAEQAAQALGQPSDRGDAEVARHVLHRAMTVALLAYLGAAAGHEVKVR
jgi:hypothetical protein